MHMQFITSPTCANVSVCGVIVCEQSISLAPFASAAAAAAAELAMARYRDSLLETAQEAVAMT